MSCFFCCFLSFRACLFSCFFVSTVVVSFALSSPLFPNNYSEKNFFGKKNLTAFSKFNLETYFNSQSPNINNEFNNINNINNNKFPFITSSFKDSDFNSFLSPYLKNGVNFSSIQMNSVNSKFLEFNQQPDKM